MKIIVCGAGGFVGTYLISHLSKNDKNEITGIDVESARYNILGMGCKVLNFDITKSVDQQSDKIEGVSFDTAIFLSQSPYYRNMPEKVGEMYSINVTGLANFLELSRRSGVQYFIYASSGSVYHPTLQAVTETSLVAPNNLYALSKFQGEQLVEQYQEYFNTAIMRFFTIYGPGQKNMLVASLAARVRDELSVTIQATDEKDIDGFTTTPFYVEDVAKVLEFFIKNRITGTFNAAGPEEISIRKIIELSANLFLKKPVIEKYIKVDRTNLIADSTKLREYYKQSFVPFEKGIRNRYSIA